MKIVSLSFILAFNLLATSAFAGARCTIKPKLEIFSMKTYKYKTSELPGVAIFSETLDSWEECYLRATELANEHYRLIDGDYTLYKNDAEIMEQVKVYFNWRYNNGSFLKFSKDYEGKVTAFTSLFQSKAKKGDQRWSDIGKKI